MVQRYPNKVNDAQTSSNLSWNINFQTRKAFTNVNSTPDCIHRYFLGNYNKSLLIYIYFFALKEQITVVLKM